MDNITGVVHTLADKVIIVSGGMDSITMLHAIKGKNDRYKLHGRPSPKLYALSFDYGSKHNSHELPLAQYHCQQLGIPHEIVKLDFIAQFFKSDLLKTGGAIPEGHYEAENMKQTVVPFRNGIMLAIAAGFAESMNATQVLIGAHAGDHAIYPDCRQDFRDAMSAATSRGTYAGVQVVAPFITFSKADIVNVGSYWGVDFTETYSCYQGGDVHCGKCGTCVERREAFDLAGVTDPTEYLDKTDFYKQVLKERADAAGARVSAEAPNDQAP